MRQLIVNVSTKKERLYVGEWELWQQSRSGTIQTERETLSIFDDQNRFLQLETLTVINSNTMVTPNNWRYQYDNHLGSACLELDENAAVISYEEYYPFGSTSYRSGKSAVEVSLKRYRYCGKERDEETGLYYYGARYYAAWIGRFTACDPKANEYLDWSPYNYTLDNPVKYIDPTGKGPEDIIFIGSNGKRVIITTADDDHRYIYVPFKFEENRTLDIGLSEFNTNNLAVGYSVGLSAEAKATYGVKASTSATIVNFPTNGKYGNYNYVYGEREISGSGGPQLGLNANIEANFFIAYSNDRENIKPSYFEGRSSTYGLTGDVKAVAGGGISLFGFQSEDEKWIGIGVGFNLGVGEGVSMLAWTRGESYSVMLSNQKPTNERSFLDRFLNEYNFNTMFGQAIYQYLQKENTYEEK